MARTLEQREGEGRIRADAAGSQREAAAGNELSGTGSGPAPEARKAVRGKTVLFAVVAVAWFALDRATKAAFDGMEPGGVLAGPYLGLIDIHLVHNTGAAWGLFAGSTAALGVLSVVVCAALAAFFFYDRRHLGVLETLGIALIVAGGAGNALDRFAQGFVTDFLEFSFFDFPVFNIADCGVTCGFVLLFLGFAIGWARGGNAAGSGCEGA